MDPLMERQTRAIEEIANEAAGQTELMKQLVEHTRGSTLGQPSKDRDLAEQVRAAEALLGRAEEEQGIGRVGESHSLPWRVARLIRHNKRKLELWQDRANAALSELINETGRDWKAPWPGEEDEGGEASSAPTPAEWKRRAEQAEQRLKEISGTLDRHDERGNATSGGLLTQAIDQILERSE